MLEKVNIGIIGCGYISEVYIEQVRTFKILELRAVADLDPERAKAKAARWKIPLVYDIAGILADPEIEIIVNLTPPGAHASVGQMVLEAGKSLYNEKPLAVLREDARLLLQTAEEKQVRVGGAPDTFMGAGLQTCRKLIDEGAIGEPVGATAFMMYRGPENWHPDPEFFFKLGGGPMFDMGPYYLTAFISLLGPVQRVTGVASTPFPERLIGSVPKKGQKILVETPTHVTGVLEFAGGASATIITSFDVWRTNLPKMEIYGSEGTLAVPDPNTFDGPVVLYRPGSDKGEEIPLLPLRRHNSRSLGVADMAHAIRAGRKHRANGEMAYHVLDIMHTIHDASREGRHIRMTSTCERPAPMPLGLREGSLD